MEPGQEIVGQLSQQDQHLLCGKLTLVAAREAQALVEALINLERDNNDEQLVLLAGQLQAAIREANSLVEHMQQGSSREHAALGPRYLGLRVALAVEFARIHEQNLVNFGVLPLYFTDEKHYDFIEQGDTLVFKDLREQIRRGNGVEVTIKGKGYTFKAEHNLSDRQKEVLLIGGVIEWMKEGQIEAASH